MKKLLLLLCLSLLVTAGYGQIKLGAIAYVNDGVNTSSLNNLHPQTGSIAASYKLSDLTTMTLSRGAGMEYTNNSTYSYVGLIPAGGTKTDAVNNDVYYEVKLSSNTKHIYLKSLTARLRTADLWTAENVSYRWSYRVGNTGGFTEIGAEDALLGFTVAAGAVSTLDLSTFSALQNVAPNADIFFRLYAWGAKAKLADGVTDVSATTRGFGFGKSNSTGLEIITVNGFLTEAPLMAAWNFTSTNATTSTTINSSFQEPWVKKTDVVNTLDIARGAGLEAASLNNAYAVTYVDELAPSSFPTNYSEAVAKNTYYSIQLRGQPVNYTQILGYRVKIRGNAVTATTARWKLIIGDASNAISETSPVLDLGLDISLTADADGVYYFLGLDDDDITAVIPPNKNAELRLYVWGGTSEIGVFGLGRVADEMHLQIYGKTLPPEDYQQILPVTLSSFNAIKQNNSVQLNWTIASENNNNYFNVLRAGEDKQFFPIGKINGSGTLATLKTYNFKDYRPNAGSNYYKLTQTDFNGDSKEIGEVQYVNLDLSSTVLSVVQNTDQNTLKALLNASKSENAMISIVNVAGSFLHQASLGLNKGVNEINVPITLNKGVYILQVKTHSGQALQAKFVK